MKYYLNRYFWWARYPLYWWRNWRYDPEKKVPFKSDEYNYVLAYNRNPKLYASVFYKGPDDITDALFMLEGGKPLDRVWCAKFPPKKPTRPMPKGTIGYA